MSAFMVSDNHIAFLVLAWKRYRPVGSGAVFSHELDEMARVLKYHCARSVNHRYAHIPKYNAPCPACGEVVCEPRVGWDPVRDRDDSSRAPCAFARVTLPREDMIAAKLGVAMTPVAAIKAAQCFDYQACEHPEWEMSHAKKLIDSVISGAIAALDGYAKAPWGIP